MYSGNSAHTAKYDYQSKLKGLGYTNTQIKEIKNERLTKEILDNRYYSVALANALDKKTLNVDYLELYTSVKDNRALTAEDFLLASRLKDKGYEQAQILNLFKNLEYWEITPLLVFDYQWDEKYISMIVYYIVIQTQKILSHYQISSLNRIQKISYLTLLPSQYM